MSIIDDLELSVRASNVLKNMGVETMDDFMALTRQSVMRQKNAGRRTWQEVSEVQTYYRHEALADAEFSAPVLSETDDFRDRAALAALQGFCSQTDSSGMWSWLPDMAVAEAWRIADAMCAARTKVEGETE